MAFIGESRLNGISSTWENFVCLDEEDCRVLSEIIGRLVARKLRTFEYYKGTHELGEATEKQIDKMNKSHDELCAAMSIEETIWKFLKK